MNSRTAQLLLAIRSLAIQEWGEVAYGWEKRPELKAELEQRIRELSQPSRACTASGLPSATCKNGETAP